MHHKMLYGLREEKKITVILNYTVVEQVKVPHGTYGRVAPRLFVRLFVPCLDHSI